MVRLQMQHSRRLCSCYQRVGLSLGIAMESCTDRHVKRLYLFAVVLHAASNATVANLCQGEVAVEGRRLMGVLPIPQP